MNKLAISRHITTARNTQTFMAEQNLKLPFKYDARPKLAQDKVFSVTPNGYGKASKPSGASVKQIVEGQFDNSRQERYDLNGLSGVSIFSGKLLTLLDLAKTVQVVVWKTQTDQGDDIDAGRGAKEAWRYGEARIRGPAEKCAQAAQQ